MKNLARVSIAIALTVCASQAKAQALPAAPFIQIAAVNGVTAPTYTAYAGAASSSPGAGWFALGGAALVGTGAYLGYQLMGYVLGDGTNSVAVPGGTDAQNAVPVPSPSPTAGQIVSYTTAAGGSGATPTEACQNYMRFAYTNQSLLTFISASYPGNCVFNYSTFPQSVAINQVLSCPAGYTGTPCALVAGQERQAQPDKRCDLSRIGTSYSFTSDADCQIAGMPKGQIRTTTNPNDTWEIAGVDNQGRPKSVTFQALPNGETQISFRSQVQDAKGDTYVQQQQARTDSAGRVVEVAQATSPGTLPVNPQTQTTTTPQTQTGTGSQYQSAPSSQTIQFPSDYARQGEADAAANKINTKLDQVKNDLLQTQAAPADPLLPDSAQFDDAFFKDTFTDLKGWRLPNHGSSCPQPSFDWDQRTYSMTAHCQLWQDHSSAITAAMMVVWSVAGLFILLRA